MSALFQIKRNLSSSCDWKVKLNAYTGYVVPIAVYASQTWLPSRTNLHEFEKLHELELLESLSDPNTVTTESLCRNARSFASIVHYSRVL